MRSFESVRPSSACNASIGTVRGRWLDTATIDVTSSPGTPSDGHSAVDLQYAPGDVGGAVRREVRDQVGDLVRPAEPAERNVAQQRCPPGRDDRVDHVRV